MNRVRMTIIWSLSIVSFVSCESGDCYQKRTETIDLHRCRVYCEATGVPKDYCSSSYYK